MFQKSKKCIFLILCMVICVVFAPCTVAFAADDTNKDLIQTTIYTGKSAKTFTTGENFRFYTDTSHVLLRSEIWSALGEGNKNFNEVKNNCVFPNLTDLGTFKPSANASSLYDGCTGFYSVGLPEKLNNKCMRLPINFKWLPNSSSDAHSLNAIGFQDSLDYLIQFNVVIRAATTNSNVLSAFPLYMVFFDNESGAISDYAKNNSHFWQNIYVRRQVANSLQYDKSTADGETMLFKLDFKIVMSGADLRYCRNFVLQFPVNQSTIDYATSDCYVNVYNPNYQAVVNGTEQEKQESQKTADNAVSDGNDSMSAIGDSAESVQGGFSGLIDTLSTNNTAASWKISKMYLPAIDGVMGQIDLLDDTEISFDTYIAMIPENIMVIIRAITTIALIVFCIKELYGLISYVLTLNKQGGEE